jgi:hypothetical protein
MQTNITIGIVAAVSLATGCYADSEISYRAGYSAPAPELEYVSPGVQVVADVDVPVFFVDGVYWRQSGGVWYRSYSHAGGWRVAASVPVAVRRIDRPERYAHFRSRAPERSPVVRDHRARAVSDHRASEVRDHRASPQAQATKRERERDHRR